MSTIFYKLFSFTAMGYLSIFANGYTSYTTSTSTSSPPAITTVSSPIPFTKFPFLDEATTTKIKLDEMNPIETQIDDNRETKRTNIKPAFYDLGIGKNMPVVNVRTANQDIPSSVSKNDQQQHILDAAEYIIEYQAVRQYPSPLDKMEQELEQEEIVTEETKTERRKQQKTQLLPVVQFKRKAEDMLHILEQHDTNDMFSNVPKPSIPTMIPKSNHQLDLNTIWVEMLIHSEQTKAVLAPVTQ